VRPLFPRALLPAWQRAGVGQERVERALGSMLRAKPTTSCAASDCYRRFATGAEEGFPGARDASG